jgi:hypothetical protein
LRVHLWRQIIPVVHRLCPSQAKSDRRYLCQFRHAYCQVSHRGGEDRPWPKAGKESPRWSGDTAAAAPTKVKSHCQDSQRRLQQRHRSCFVRSDVSFGILRGLNEKRESDPLSAQLKNVRFQETNSLFCP